eukprot:TRINITY_DN13575_c0_g1_i10.p1 TRINITY_DN13575_c0_g1~~TRINITY_DN13575_c0_g1_i10.p1  ORF type:complete len:211 (+),score=92.44 TRINITY_DN13575_c0_g1_i10:246-878(+)
MNLKSQLEGKDKDYQLQELTEQCRDLTEYKLLCEKRIVELDPEHPVPVKAEHLGKPRAQLKEQSENAELDKLEFLESEKAAIEESLREQILSNEEQRNYIQILKQALESKIDSLGLSDLLQSVVKSGGDQEELFVKLSAMQEEVNKKQKAMDDREEDIRDMEEIIVELKSETESNKKTLDEQSKLLSKALNDKEEIVRKYETLVAEVRSG